jgi:Right handed beta helix region
MRTHTSATAVLLAATGLGVSAFAGPLNPPAGPVGPTMKTMTEVEPRIAINAANTPGDVNCVFKIVQRGSYYLTGNITGQAGKFTIQIATDNVTLDLGGFNINGGAQGVNVQSAAGTRSNIAIRNGTIIGCPNGGLDATLADGCVLQDLRAQACPGGGLYAGPQARIEHCTADHCGAVGISAQVGSRISDCQASYNGTSGVQIRDVGEVVNTTASYNTFRGIDAWNQVSIRNCTVSHNGESGIDLGSTCVVQSCTLISNALKGVHGGGGCDVVGCKSDYNGDHGIEIASGSVINCTSSFNGQVTQSGAGIYVTGAWGTKVEGNTVANQAYGVFATQGGCFIVRNFMHNCVHPYEVAGATTWGQIVSGPAYIDSTVGGWANFVN